MLRCLAHYCEFTASPRMITMKPPSVPDMTSGQCYLMITRNPVEGVHGSCIIEKVGGAFEEEPDEDKGPQDKDD